jgi:crotonobetainyl-CoA:carnitine CoA-transferase CaiB-like acyl-CoA transferase
VAAHVARQPSRPVAIAAGILAELGAQVIAADVEPDGVVASMGGGSAVRVHARDAAATPAGLPPGTGELAVALCLVAATGAAVLGGSDCEVDPCAVAAQLVLPELLAAERGDEPPPVTQPTPTREGTLWRDLGEDEERLLSDLLDGEPIEHVRAADIASLGQAAGLALVDYRARSAWPGHVPLAELEPLPARGRMPVLPQDRGPLAGTRVCDMTAMWSGPLATWLLAALGAEVLKVEPGCRLDGTRRAEDPALFQALNRNKRRLDLDLRDAGQRAEFAHELAESDMVVSNFTPRVATNLGIEPATLAAGRRRPLACVQMPAFPAGAAERQWRAYGHGIHAIAGLGMDAAGRPWAARSPYCDALTGFAAAAVAVSLRVSSITSGTSWAAEVPMLNVALRLADLAGSPRAARRPSSDGGRDALVELATPAGPVRCPRSPFRGPGLPIPDLPAPALPRPEVVL